MQTEYDFDLLKYFSYLLNQRIYCITDERMNRFLKFYQNISFKKSKIEKYYDLHICIE